MINIPTDKSVKHCPFCGSRPVITSSEWYKDGGGKIAKITCVNCDTEMIEFALYDNEGTPYEQLIAKLKKRWNRRVS